VGVICHHTATASSGNMPTLHMLIDGRSDLAGPLAQLGLGRDGTFYVIAAGRCNHAGKGSWNGVTDGNGHFIGIEAENSGLANDPWPPVQVDAYQRGVAAILRRLGRTAADCIGHKEWAPGRKTDPSFDMNAFRAAVAAILNGNAPAPVLIPATDPITAKPTVRRGATGALVQDIQRAVGTTADGVFGGGTEAAVREFQRAHGLVPDGIVGPKTWVVLAGATTPTSPPS
jgi:peptidoglycan hydrolase-like protein with peptidoglycan-binding domain